MHGRYLVLPAAPPGPAPLLVGFHGYAEDAEAQLDRLRSIPESNCWTIVSIQGLHRFYQRRTNQVVASWMTRQDRDLAIADNIEYVTKCLDAVAAQWPARSKVVFAGFSQGVGMAFRAAVNANLDARDVIAVGGDIPPELNPASLRRISAALIVRGKSDQSYTMAQFAADELRLRQCSVSARAIEFDGGHEWSSDVGQAAGQFLRARHAY